MRGDRSYDPLHPLQLAFAGEVNDVLQWARYAATTIESVGPRYYIYSFSVAAEEPIETVYVGMTRNPAMRFSDHRRKPWFQRVNWSCVDYLCCSSHQCSIYDFKRAAREIETWLIDRTEPTENLRLR